ncbi:helix-turn-helix domain-containing protein [Zavarzinia sp.]|uniref:helix-turn-helix domain-containing protein n=1 Tax=Zavarzinia sp. TaxID=2027920 RepID=UPI003BB7B12B
MARFKLDPANPPKMSAAERSRLDAMTDGQITAAALTDPDNPPMSEAEIDRLAMAALAQRVRKSMGLTQQEFAARYRINYGRLRDIEQGRGKRADTALAAYLQVIEREPAAVNRALSAAE